MLEPQERELLKRAVDLSEKNHAILKKMRRSMLLGRFFHVFYWAIIIGSAVGAYYFIQPYIDGILGGVNNFQDRVSGIKNIFDSLPTN